MPRYRFNEFVLSPRQRLLLRGEKEHPLIPRYFDLLLFLVERRHEAVHRRDIFDRVWTDAIVSDSALSQAIRTIRRALDDDPREPRFIRTVSRHGYRFVFTDVREEDDDGGWPPVVVAATPVAEVVVETPPAPTDPFEPLIARITRVAADAAEEEDQREAAELLHGLGTAEALRRLDQTPGHALGRALLRDTRWDAPGSGAVPLMGQPAMIATARELIRLRLNRASREVARRWAGASAVSALVGVIAGVIGGLVLTIAPDSTASLAVVPVLALIGAGCGALGGAGVGAGLSAAEAAARSRRTLALTLGAAVGGGIAGSMAQWLARWTLAALVGVRLDIGGGLEGLIIGAAAGLGYGLATSGTEGGLAAPRGKRRLRVALVTALFCGVAGLLLSMAGRPLAAGTIHMIATGSGGTQAALTPLGRLMGEPGFGPVTRTLIGTGETLLFGLGLAFGLTRRR
jgi:DNA-binding winged helix-turn-helix (wHTH) protein